MLRRGAGLQMPPVHQQQQSEPALTAGAAEPPKQPNGDGTATPPGASAPSPDPVGAPGRDAGTEGPAGERSGNKDAEPRVGAAPPQPQYAGGYYGQGGGYPYGCFPEQQWGYPSGPPQQQQYYEARAYGPGPWQSFKP